jgi:hypothetical protein
MKQDYYHTIKEGYVDLFKDEKGWSTNEAAGKLRMSRISLHNIINKEEHPNIHNLNALSDIVDRHPLALTDEDGRLIIPKNCSLESQGLYEYLSSNLGGRKYNERTKIQELSSVADAKCYHLVFFVRKSLFENKPKMVALPEVTPDAIIKQLKYAGSQQITEQEAFEILNAAFILYSKSRKKA